jgi:hypothetical protein
MTIFVHSIHKKCHPKSYRSDIQYHMTLNIVFSVPPCIFGWNSKFYQCDRFTKNKFQWGMTAFHSCGTLPQVTIMNRSNCHAMAKILSREPLRSGALWCFLHVKHNMANPMHCTVYWHRCIHLGEIRVCVLCTYFISFWNTWGVWPPD